MRGYAICGEHRSGSSFLCRLLESTGVLGRPSEYFGMQPQLRKGIVDYPTDAEGQLQAILRLGATPNGVYGVKMFVWHAVRASAVRWAERLPNLSFIHLVRLDALGQAISLVRAEQTDQWGDEREALGEAVYDFKRINDALGRVLQARARWEYFLGRNGLRVLYLDYETIQQQPQRAIDAIARFVGVSEPAIADPGVALTGRQRDGLNDQWRSRFVAQARNLAVF